MKYKVYFTDTEKEFLIQVLNKFMIDVNLKDFPLKNKLLINENSFYIDEIEFLYLYLKIFKQTIEKYLNIRETNNENLRLNYKGTNHCLRKCRNFLVEHDVSVSELNISSDKFIKNFLEKFI